MAIIEPVEFTSKKGKKILVRSAQKDDAQSVLEAMTETVKTSPFVLHTFDDFKNKTVEAEEVFIERAVISPTSFFLVALHCGKVVGTCDFVEPNRTAFEMYRKLGFEVVHTTPQAYQLSEGEFVSNISMRLEIKK